MDCLTKRLKDFVKSRGAPLVGIAPVERLSKAPHGHRPRDFLPDAASVISIGLRMNKSPIFQLPRTLREYEMNYDMANLKLNWLALEATHFLEDLGYKALAIPASVPYDTKKNSGDISHKHAAVAAGLGTFGLNNLVLTKKYGPYVRFVTVVTNANLTFDQPLMKNICLRERCLRCIRACPSRALEDPHFDAIEGWYMNKEKCQGYIDTFSGGSVCGLCIQACPVGIRQED